MAVTTPTTRASPPMGSSNFPFFALTRDNRNVPSTAATTKALSPGWIDRSITRMSPEQIPRFLLSSPFARKRKVAAGCRISRAFKSRRFSANCSDGLAKPVNFKADRLSFLLRYINSIILYLLYSTI
jgi:hypothetical protein